MILLKQIKIINFISHEQTQIDFQETENVSIEGASGSGKTSIFEALTWCLFGVARTDTRSLIRKGASSTSVTTKLKDSESTFAITRTISKSGKTTLICTKADSENNFKAIEKVGIKETQDWIEKTLLKTSYNLFVNSICYLQNGSDSFVNQNASKRKEILLDLIGISNIDEYYIKSREKLTIEENNCSILKTKKDSLIKNIEGFRPLANWLKTNTIDISEINVKITNLNYQLGGLKVEKEDVDKNRLLRQEYLYSIEKLENDTNLRVGKINVSKSLIEAHRAIDLATLDSKVELYNKNLKDLENSEKTIKTEVDKQNKINEFLSNKPVAIDYQKDIDELNKQLIPLIKESGKCPSGDNCPFVKPIARQIEFLSNQITEKQSQLDEYIKKTNKWTYEFEKLPQPKNIESLYSIHDGIKSTINELKKFKDERDRYTYQSENISSQESILSEYEALNKKDSLEIDGLRKKIKEIDSTTSQEHIRTIIDGIKSLEDEIRKISDERDLFIKHKSIATQAQANINLSEKEVSKLEKEILDSNGRINILNITKEAFGQKGIKTLVIDWVIPELENKINSIIEKLSDFRIKLDTQRKSADGESIIEGLFITVFNENNHEIPIEGLSGGEGVKIKIAITEALASMNSNIGFRIFDECVVALDNDSVEGFADVIKVIKSTSNQLYLISHLQEMKDLFEKKIGVVKINGISKII